ncbi:MAG: hypothetical protein ACO3EZ_15810 [Prochlorotrichaceae cyanobacterium]
MSNPHSSEKASAQPPGGSASQPSSDSPPSTLDPLQLLQTQQDDFKGEMDRLNQEMEVLRGWFQTLVSGLLIAIVIAVSIASWFAYRLLLQQQSIDQEAQEAATVREDLLQRVTLLEEELSALTEEVGISSATFRGTFQTNQADIELLRDRLNQLETRQSSLEANKQPTTESSNNNASDR